MMNIRIFAALLACWLGLSVLAQDSWVPADGERQFIYRVALCDKQGTPFTLQQPEAFLSPKSVLRRQRQGLPVDSTDLPVSPVYVKALRAAHVEIVGMSKWNNTVLVRSTSRQRLERLARLPFVTACKRVWTSPDSLRERPRRVPFHREVRQWEQVSEGPFGAAQKQVEMLHGDELHRAGYRGRGVTIAVLDGGFMNVDKIPAFEQVHIMGECDFVSGTASSVYKNVDHGTMVLSVMALDLPDVFVGTAPEADYWLLRCEDNDTEHLIEEDYWAEAVEFADSVGADIVSSSLGYYHFDDKQQNHRYAEQDGHTALISNTASMAAAKGMVVVNSAGNDGMGTWKKIIFPADASDILTVGAVTPGGVNAAFSSIGPSADGRVKPDVMALGSPTAVMTGRGTLSQETGTSYAVPLVSGLVACLWQAMRDRSALQLMDLVRQSGSNSLTPDNVMGYGIPDFWRAYQKGRK